MQPAMRLDPRLAPSMTRPPAGVDDQRRSIALLNLFRGQALGLPSGEDVAAAVAQRTGDQIDILGQDRTGLAHPAPLWFYVLREAELLGAGERLGPVGGRIVAEVLVGLAAKDRSSLLAHAGPFEPVLGQTPGEFTIADLLRIAGAAT